jgi:hypothetical protein
LSGYLSDLYRVPLHQLQIFARITASLTQQFQDIGTAVGSAVVAKVRGLTKRKDATQRTAESRIISARYLAELAKFRVVDPGVNCSRR